MRGVLLYLIIFLTAKSAYSQEKNEKPIEIRADISNPMGCAASQLFKKVTFIPLETKKECIVDEITQLFITKKYFIILDYGSDVVFIFNKDGSFHSKINKIEGISNKYSDAVFERIGIDVDSSEIYIQSFHGDGKLFIYNYDGIFKRTELVPDSAYAMIKPGRDEVLYQNGVGGFNPAKNDSLAYDLTLMHANMAKQNFLPYNIKNLPSIDDVEPLGMGDFYMSSYGNKNEECNFFYTGIYNYNIYNFYQNSLQLKYKLIFPVNFSLPGDFMSNPIYQNSHLKYFSKSGNKIYSLKNVYQAKDLLSFTCSYSANIVPGELVTPFIYDLKRQLLYSIYRIIPDNVCYNLPVFYTIKNFVAADNNDFYGFVSSRSLFYVKQMIKKGVKFDPVLTKFFSNKNQEQNPVILDFEVK